MTPSEIEQQAAEDSFLRGYHAIPDDAKLRAMSYAGLCAQLQSSAPGTAAFMVIEAEKMRRDALSAYPEKSITEVNPPERKHPSQEPLRDKTLPRLAITVIGGVIVVSVVFIGRHYFGLPF